MLPSVQGDLDAMGQSGGAWQAMLFRMSGRTGDGTELTIEEISTRIYPLFALRDKVMRVVFSAIDKVGHFLPCFLAGADGI
jgi:hypothetical protein